MKKLIHVLRSKLTRYRSFLFVSFVLLLLLLIVGSSAYILLSSRPQVQTKAAPSQLSAYKSQLLKGMSSSLLKERRKLLLSEMKKNPSTFIASDAVFTEDEIRLIDKNTGLQTRKSLQKEGLLEEHVSNISGVYNIMYADTLKDESQKIPSVTSISNARNNVNSIYQLIHTQQKEEPATGSQVSFSKAILIDNVLFAESMDSQIAKKANVLGLSTATSTEKGKLEYLVIPFYFKEEDPSTYVPPFTKQDIEREIFLQSNSKSSSSFYKVGSYGKVDLKGKVLDWIQIPESKYLIWTASDSCAYDLWSDAADRILAELGDFSAYKHRIYIFPQQTTCRFLLSDTNEYVGWAGMGTVGAIDNKEGIPQKIWINGFNSSAVFSHEIGHNIGLHHAKQIVCGNRSIYAYYQCKKEEYGNQFCSMGNAYLYGQFNSVYKRILDWIPDTHQSIEIKTSGNYILTNSDIKPKENIGSTSINGSATDVKLYRIAKNNTKENYYIELRSPCAFDLQCEPKIFINLFMEDRTHLINPNPALNDSNHSYLDKDSVFYDEMNKILIRVMYIRPTEASISVIFDPVKFLIPTSVPVTPQTIKHDQVM